MMPIIITADKETLNIITEVLSSRITYVKGTLNASAKEVMGISGVISQIKKQVDESEIVCPIQKLVNKG